MTAYATLSDLAQSVPQSVIDEATAAGVDVSAKLEKISRRCDFKLRDRYTLPLAVVDPVLTEIVCRIARYELYLTIGSNREGEIQEFKDDAAAAWLLMLDLVNQKGSFDVGNVPPGEGDIEPESGPFAVITAKPVGWGKP